MPDPLPVRKRAGAGQSNTCHIKQVIGDISRVIRSYGRDRVPDWGNVRNVPGKCYHNNRCSGPPPEKGCAVLPHFSPLRCSDVRSSGVFSGDALCCQLHRQPPPSETNAQ